MGLFKANPLGGQTKKRKKSSPSPWARALNSLARIFKGGRKRPGARKLSHGDREGRRRSVTQPLPPPPFLPQRQPTLELPPPGVRRGMQTLERQWAAQWPEAINTDKKGVTSPPSGPETTKTRASLSKGRSALEHPSLAPETSLSPTLTSIVAPPILAQGAIEGPPVFWAYLDSFLKEQNSRHTQRAYERDLRDFLGYLEGTKQALNIHSLVQYREHLEISTSQRTQVPLSRVSINRKIATVKSFLNWMVLQGVIHQNPARAMKSFRAGRVSPTRDVPDDKVRALLDAPQKHRVSGYQHYCILLILFRLGLRRSELVDLEVQDFYEQLSTRVVRIRGKGDKERILPLPDDIYGALTTYLRMTQRSWQSQGPLFCPQKNNRTKDLDKKLNPNTVAYIVQRYAKKVGIDYRISPHSARATAVSNALDHQASHRAVQYMAGWSSPLMVSRYDKRAADIRHSAVKYVRYNQGDDVGKDADKGALMVKLEERGKEGPS